MESVTRVQVRENFHLELEFSTGERRMFDARPYLGGFPAPQGPPTIRARLRCLRHGVLAGRSRDVRARGIERGGIVQLAKRERNNDQLHFSAARTLAKASAIGTVVVRPARPRN